MSTISQTRLNLAGTRAGHGRHEGGTLTALDRPDYVVGRMTELCATISPISNFACRCRERFPVSMPRQSVAKTTSFTLLHELPHGDTRQARPWSFDSCTRSAWSAYLGRRSTGRPVLPLGACVPTSPELCAASSGAACLFAPLAPIVFGWRLHPLSRCRRVISAGRCSLGGALGLLLAGVACVFRSRCLADYRGGLRLHLGSFD